VIGCVLVVTCIEGLVSLLYIRGSPPLRNTGLFSALTVVQCRSLGFPLDIRCCPLGWDRVFLRLQHFTLAPAYGRSSLTTAAHGLARKVLQSIRIPSYPDSSFKPFHIGGSAEKKCSNDPDTTTEDFDSSIPRERQEQSNSRGSKVAKRTIVNAPRTIRGLGALREVANLILSSREYPKNRPYSRRPLS